ncbi:heat shock 70 kDa protein 12A-like isoform X2 [Dreissena polymorpha]|uniref:heat shock 70 kDa protein 12A-like isoform X2 n=1 Tax=Dreissena polymorpha TaxID=45954 RepID=UPI0022653A21|nr:heat shock 70 kDa protein 12A-like isoform X2 [Dreissena polymorpha]
MSEKKEQIPPIPKPRQFRTTSNSNTKHTVPVHILDESLTVTSNQDQKSQPLTPGAEGTSVDTDSNQRDPPSGPSTNKGKLQIFDLDESTTNPAHVDEHTKATSSSNAENTHSDSHGNLRRGAKVNDDKSDSDGIDPETFENIFRLNKKDSDNALLRTGTEDKVGHQEDIDNVHKGQSDYDPDGIDSGPASQFRPRPTGRHKKTEERCEGNPDLSRSSVREKHNFFKSVIEKQVSETEPKAILRPKKQKPSFRGDQRQSGIGQSRKTDDADNIDAGPALLSRELPKVVQQENRGDIDRSSMTLTDKKAFFASMIDKQASDVVDSQASDVVQRPKRCEPLVQSKRISTDNKAARYEREGNLLCETKDSYAKIWISESGNRMSEDMKAYLKKSNAMVTVAIDFGTTFSGCVFSMRDNPGKIYILNAQGGASSKVPTAILYDPRRKMHSFGYEALEHYASISSADERYIWRLFEQFKMKLFTRNTSISKNFEIKDNHGKTKLALDIFADALRYMAEHIKKEIHARVPGFDDDIHWVITVPAIWSTMSRTFMRVAAQKAGIQNERLSLALEPEAAAICCKCESSLELQAGKRFMIVDIGGGTTDIAVCEVNEGTSLKELHQPSGGDFGGINVDQKFIELFIEIFGEDVLTEFKDKQTKSYMEMMADFELKKRLFEGTNTCQIKVDPILLEMCNKSTGIDVVSIMKESPLSQRVEWKFGKLILRTETVKCFFDVVIDKILEAIKCILAKVEKIDTIILVGGFSESPYLCSRLEKNFPGKISKVEDPVLAVIKGAVLIGRDPYAIASRVCEYTYGIAGTMKYKSHHPGKNRFDLNGVAMCDNCFFKHIEIGTEVSVHDEENAVEHEYFPSTGVQTQAILEVYASTDKDPEYIDDTCHLVGFIKVDIDPRGDFWAKILVKMFFGGTEIKVVITDVKNGKVQRGSVDFWG